MLKSEKICYECGKKIFGAWTLSGDMELVDVKNDGNHCVFFIRKKNGNGKVYEIMCEVGDNPDNCKYYLERMVVLDNEKR